MDSETQSPEIIITSSPLQSLKAKIKWMQDVSFKGSSESGHEVVLDGPKELGGKSSGMRPMEMMLIGMGGCTSFDVVTILKRSRQQITGCIAEIEAIRADEIPKVFTSIHIHFVFLKWKCIRFNFIRTFI